MTETIARIRSLYAEERFAETVEFIRAAIASADLPPEDWRLVANAANRLNDRYAAARAADNWLRGEPDRFEAIQFAAQARASAGEIAPAVALARDLAVRFANTPHAPYSAAEIIAQSGEIDEAVALYKRAFALDGRFSGAWEHISRLKKFKPGDPDLQTIATLVERSSPLGRAFLISAHYACANCLDSLGEYDEAFPHYQQAMRYVRETSAYTFDHYTAPIRRGLEAYTEEFMAGYVGAGAESEQPIFIVGPPRSGTTLVEQILASHPKVAGGGESSALRVAFWRLAEGDADKIASRVRQNPKLWREIGGKYLDYTRELFGDAERITNKDISSIGSVGLIRLALPNAKIIFCRRDPIDAGWSCAKAHFGPSLAWAFDFDHIAQYYTEFSRAQDAWRLRLGGNVLDIRYEDVVADHRREIDRILTFCDLPPDHACYEFHKTTRQVSTASIYQIRQPLFSTSVGAWRKYEKHLTPLADAMARHAA